MVFQQSDQFSNTTSAKTIALPIREVQYMPSTDHGLLRKNLLTTVPLGLIFLVALSIRIFYSWHDRVIAADGISYINVAQSIITRFDFSAAGHFPPLYPILIGIFSYVTPYDEVAGKVVSTIMGSVLVFPLYLLGKELFTQRVGYIAAVLTALSPALAGISAIVLSQSTYITILVTALYLCWSSFKSTSYRRSVAAGFMFGAAYLSRPEAILVFAGISAVLLFFRPATLSPKDNLKLLLCTWTAFFITALPYIVLLHNIFGTWQLTGKSSVTLADSLGWYLKRPDLKREPGFAGLTYLDIVTQYPDFLWKNTIKNLPAAWAELPFHIWLISLLGVISAFLSLAKWRRLLFLGSTFLPLGIIIVFFWIDGHYFSPCIPILFLFTGEGLLTVEKGVHWIFNRIGHVKLAESIPFAFLFGIAIATVSILPGLLVDRSTPYHFSQDGARYDHKLIGLKLKKLLPPKAKVMVKSGRIAFYGDFQRIDIPQASLAEILQAAKDGNARYLIADGTLLSARPQMEPFFIPLLVTQEQVFTSGPFEQLPVFPGGLRLLFLYKDPASVGVAVYEFP